MNNIIYVRVTQYQKHLIKDLLEENDILFEANESLRDRGYTLQIEWVPGLVIDTFVKKVTVEDLGDIEHAITMEAFNDIQKMINGDITDFCGVISDKIYLSMAETNIILHKNGKILMAMPFSYTPIYKENTQ